MKYQIEGKYRGYKYSTPWMMEGEFTSLRAARKEAQRIARELTEDGDGGKWQLRLIKWDATVIYKLP